ncbi:LAFE_0F13080g1_1 [Lachancea fermentati]|uniref:LAFE_0F13080g1_1 n=1 Tax=Lachancea fermentati TaxID=4955 RepID=A0A1G4MG00_LACFM|nr:LAFE_0F13080g1_1 [Lachancea fermentati]
MFVTDKLRHWLGSLWEYFLSLFYQKELNIVIVGLQNSGKTSLTSALLGRPFQQDTIPTLGMRMDQFFLGSNMVKVFDLAGQHRFHHLWNRYFVKADLIIYMMDLSDLTNWAESKQKLQEVILTTNEERIPMLILGNKSDLLNTDDLLAANGKSRKKSADGQGMMEQWKYMAPLLSNYEYEDIPTYQLDDNNLYVLKNIEILSKEIGVDLKSGFLHTSKGQVFLDRDIGIFSISCKEGDYIQDILQWIAQL